MSKYTKDQLREAIMRLTMCALRECEVCRYKDRPKIELPSEDCKERVARNMNILANVCLRSKNREMKEPIGRQGRG